MIIFNHIFNDYDDYAKLYEQNILRYIDTGHTRLMTVGYTHELLAIVSFTASQ